MNVKPQPIHAAPVPLPKYDSILVAVDSSDHANRGVLEAVELASVFGSQLTAAHVYAAKLHDARFRQMEGGLPPKFREENELERQRDVHDDLITRGLSVITDAYFDRVDAAAERLGRRTGRRSLEGKNYRELCREANSGGYDLLVMGALGLGAVKGSRLGTVCQRVSRRARIDTLVIKDPNRSFSEGPVVVAVDGSAKSYGGLLTALELARAWQLPLKVVSAFDPYYHYVAFNRIAGVLSEEAGRVFRFRDQEKLHEEIIDSGLAKIYQGHLAVAGSIAADYGMEVETVLLDGKPHEVIARYLESVNPALLVVGTTGVHADEELEIGGNTEYLLNDARCAVLLSQRSHAPRLDHLAAVTTSWTREAEARLERVPGFAQGMARMAILRYAQEQGHTVVTARIVEEATATLMPGHAERAMSDILAFRQETDGPAAAEGAAPVTWRDEATRLLLGVSDLSLRGNIGMRAEKRARAAGAARVEAEHVRPFLGNDDPPGTSADEATPGLEWDAAALACLMRVPEGFMRDRSRARVEACARERGCDRVSLPVAEAALARAREVMTAARPPAPPTPSDTGHWTEGARKMLEGVPVGFCRDMTLDAAQAIAGHRGVSTIDEGFVAELLETIKGGSAAVEPAMEWDAVALARLDRVPPFVHGMLVREIEGWAARHGMERVDRPTVEEVLGRWRTDGIFHLDPNDPRNR